MGIDPIASQPSLGQEETKIRRTIELLGHTINTRQSRRAGETYLLALNCVQIRVTGTSSYKVCKVG